MDIKGQDASVHDPVNVPVLTKRQQYERQPARMSDRRFYCSAEWRAFRDEFLQSHPCCEDCLMQTPVRWVASEHIHHMQARKARPDLTFDRRNCRALCESHHSQREAAERKAKREQAKDRS
jgi:hypothetical protein